MAGVARDPQKQLLFADDAVHGRPNAHSRSANADRGGFRWNAERKPSIRPGRVLRRIPGALIATWLLAFLGALSAAEGQPPPVVLGMSTALSGPAAELGQNMRQGVLTAIARTNRAGGIGGRMLELIALDDGYEPSRTVPNMRRLIADPDVTAIVGNVGTPTAIAALPLVNRSKIPFFAPYTGAGALRRDPPDRHVFNYRAGYVDETAAMIDALMAHTSIRPEEIAFFTQRDAYGDAGFIGGILALERHGLRDQDSILHVRYERNTLAVENAVASILLRDPPVRALIMVGAYAPCAKMIRLARNHGLDPLFLNVSFVGSAPLAEALGEDVGDVLVTQVVPHFGSDLPIVKQYRADLGLLDPGAQPTFGGLEGYIAIRVLTRAMHRLKARPDRQNTIDALEQLGTFDIGLGFPLHLSAAQHQASRRVWPTLLKGGAVVPFEWSRLKALADREDDRP